MDPPTMPVDHVTLTSAACHAVMQLTTLQRCFSTEQRRLGISMQVEQLSTDMETVQTPALQAHHNQAKPAATCIYVHIAKLHCNVMRG